MGCPWITFLSNNNNSTTLVSCLCSVNNSPIHKKTSYLLTRWYYVFIITAIFNIPTYMLTLHLKLFFFLIQVICHNLRHLLDHVFVFVFPSLNTFVSLEKSCILLVSMLLVSGFFFFVKTQANHIQVKVRAITIFIRMNLS